MSESHRPGRGRRWALQDAKNKLSEVVRAAERGEPQIVTRRGVETAVVISHDDFERLSGGPTYARGSLAKSLLAMPASDDATEFERVQLVPQDVDL
jgi:prevent-host-death family protein